MGPAEQRPEPVATRGRPRRVRVVFGLVAPALAVAAYLDALSNPFVYLDEPAVLFNPSLGETLTLRGVLGFDPARPFVNLSFAIDRLFWGFTSFGFHVTNVALHAAAVALFYGLCTRLLADTSPSDEAPEWPAFCAALLLALHPVMSTTVNQVAARGELLCAVGVFAGLTFARRAFVHRSLAAAVLACACALLAAGSSYTAAVLPLALVASDMWVHADTLRRRVAWIDAPIAITVVVLAALRLWTLPAGSLGARGPIDNLLTESIVIWRYVALLLVPRGLAVVHGVREITTLLDVRALGACAGSVLVAYAAWRCRASRPLVAAGLAWFLIALAPALIFPLRLPMAEHRLYVAAPGLFLAVVAAARRPLASSHVTRLVALALIGFCGWLTLDRNGVWREPTALWQEAVRLSPGLAEAHLRYGDALREAGQCGEALVEYRTVLQREPQNPEALTGERRCEGK